MNAPRPNEPARTAFFFAPDGRPCLWHGSEVGASNPPTVPLRARNALTLHGGLIMVLALPDQQAKSQNF